MKLISSLRLEISHSYRYHGPWTHSISVLEIFQPPASFATDPTKRCWKDPFYVVLLTLGAWESEVDVNMLQKK